MSNKNKNKHKNRVPEISSYLIVKNEVDNLPELVKDLRTFSEEVIVVDTGSTDGTLEWLKENVDDVLKMYEFEWIDDFSAARNFALSKVTKSWSFWCDADDRISQQLIDKLNELKPQLNSFEACTAFGVMYHYASNFTQWRHRLFRMSDKPRWECVCHECILVDNMKSFLLDEDCFVIHTHDGGNCTRNISTFEKNLEKGHKLSTREIFCYLHEINAIEGRQKEAVDLAMANIFNDDTWRVFAWESFADVLCPYWLSSKALSHLGIAIMDRYEKKSGLRGDGYYLRAVMHDMVEEYDLSLKDCYSAINTVITGVETYNENEQFSKLLPAMSIYNTVQDPFTRSRMAEIIKLYVNKYDIANQFCKENNIEFPEMHEICVNVDENVNNE